MKNVLVFVLLISIILVIGILYYDSYTCSRNVVETLQSNDKLKAINAKYNFVVPDASMPEFKELLQSRGYMNFAKMYLDSGFLSQGTYNDREWYDRNRNFHPRAVPTFTGSVSSPEQCQARANGMKKSVIGVQYYGQCFVGDDINRAKGYGPDTRPEARREKLGYGWSNQVYHRTIVDDEVVNQRDLDEYEEVIKWLTSKQLSINTYDEFKKLINLIKSPEGFEGIGKPPVPPEGPPQPRIVTSLNIIGSTFDEIATAWENTFSEPPSSSSTNRYKLEFHENTPEYPELVTDSINEFSKIDKALIPSLMVMLKNNNIRNTLDIQHLKNNLAKIGYTATSTTNLHEILKVLNEYGRKGFDIDDAFVNRYMNFGLTPNSDLRAFISQLNKLNVKDTDMSKFNSTQIINFVHFDHFVALVSPLGVKHGDSFNKFCSIMEGFYTLSTRNELELFFKNIRNYFKNNSITLADVETFKNDLLKYKITYGEYALMITKYFSKITIHSSYKVFIENFVNIYNTQYIRGTPDLPISTNANSVGTISLYNGTLEFFKDALENGFRLNKGIDGNRMFDEYKKTNVSGTYMIFENSVIQPFTTFEGFTSLPNDVVPQKTVEGLATTGYYDSLIRLGFTDVDNMMIILPENTSNVAVKQNPNELSTRVKKYVGAANDNDIVVVLSYLKSINSAKSEIYTCLSYFNGIGVNSMLKFTQLTNALSILGFNSFQHIFDFLEKLNELSITFEGLDTFSSTLAGFGLTYKRSADLFFSFLDTLTHYNITNTYSKYDTKNTMFYNFMYNMKLDNIKYDKYKIFELAMFTSFTGGNRLRDSIPLTHENPILEIQLRDIITRKDSILFGVDNTINGKNSNEPSNRALQLDPAIDIGKLYANITKSNTIMPLVPIKLENNTIIKPEEIYGYMLDHRTNIINNNLRLVSQILTPYEYMMMKIEPGHLHARSVMSRLCSLLKQNMDSGMYASNSMVDLLLNSVRTFPYNTFHILCASYKISGDMYDKDNLTANEANNYTLPPPVKEPTAEKFSTLTSVNESYGNYQSMFSSNRTFPFTKISDTKLYDSYDLSKTSFMNHSNVM